MLYHVSPGGNYNSKMSCKESVQDVVKTNPRTVDKTMQNEQHIGSTVQKCYYK